MHYDNQKRCSISRDTYVSKKRCSFYLIWTEALADDNDLVDPLLGQTLFCLFIPSRSCPKCASATIGWLISVQLRIRLCRWFRRIWPVEIYPFLVYVMDTLNRPRRAALHSLAWRKEFSTRQTAKYHGQDTRLRVPRGGSVIEEFFRSFNPSLSPPRRHESLRLFLEQAGEQHSFPGAIGSISRSPDGRLIAMVDDRCDPCLKFTSLPESAAFLPVRQWESEEYMRRPPEGLNVQVCGLDAVKLYDHLNKDVSYLVMKLMALSHLLREQVAQSAALCKFHPSSINHG